MLDAQIIAPTTGTVSEIVPTVGEMVAMNVPVVRMVGQDAPDIEALVPEADVVKVLLGQEAMVTLDAYGDNVKFKATVSAKDPAETKVQDAVYYKIRVLVDPAGKEVKPGMTANVTIKTGEAVDAYVIPLRGIRTNADGSNSVRVLVNGQPIVKNVVLGLRGNEGRVEVKSGLNEGEAVIVGEPSAVPVK
jgi:multidrug efflux pump subunit AcrA (membrane-fusion protein)